MRSLRGSKDEEAAAALATFERVIVACYQIVLRILMWIIELAPYAIALAVAEPEPFEVLDHCCTPFGRRRLRQWLCRPLYRIADITARQRLGLSQHEAARRLGEMVARGDLPDGEAAKTMAECDIGSLECV